MNQKYGYTGWQLKLIALFYLIFVLQAGFLIKTQSPVTDAVAFHIVNGYSYLKTQDFRMSPATPPLIREWMAVPWLFLNPELDLENADWRDAESVPFGLNFMFRQHADQAELLLALSRIQILILASVLFFFLKRWSFELYGARASLAAVTLYAFSPMMIAYSSVANIEIGIALFYSLTAYQLYRSSRRGGRFPFWAGIFWGAAMASKYTGVIMAPAVLLLLFIGRPPWKALLHFIGMGLVACVVIWSTYFFQMTPILTEGVPRAAEKLQYIDKITSAVHLQVLSDPLKNAAQYMNMPLSQWFLGFMGIARSHQEDYRHFFFGEWRQDQVWWHYFFSFAVKATLPFLMLLALRILTSVKGIVKSGAGGAPFLLLPCAILFFMTCLDTTGVGIRYLIPTFPLLYIWVSGLFADGAANWRRFLWILILIHPVAAVYRFPHYLAYFNESIGGPSQAYKYVRANDLEWGQNLKLLASYVKKHDIQLIRTSLFGAKDEKYYGIPSVNVNEADYQKPAKGWYAISVFTIQHFSWTESVEPKAVLGHTIRIYHFE